MSHNVLEVIEYGKTQHVRREPLKHGIRGNVQTLEHMARIVRREAHDLEIEKFVKSQIFQNVPAHDDKAEMDACYYFVRDRIAWRRDKPFTERVADSRTTLSLKWGDCVNKSVMLASFIAVGTGHTPYFTCGSSQFSKDFEFDHVWVGVKHKGQHYSYDATPNDKPPGFEAPMPVRVMVDFWDGKLKLVRLN